MRWAGPVLLALLLVPGHPAGVGGTPAALARAGTVTAAQPQVYRFTSDGESFTVVHCSAQGFPASFSTTSTCQVDGDDEAWLIVNDVPVHRTSPQTFNGTYAVSQWSGAVTEVARICSGGYAYFNEGVSATYRVDARPVCVDVTPP